MNTPPRDKESQPQESQATDIESQTQPVLSPDVSPIKTPPTKSPEGVAQYDPSAEKQPEENESSEFDDEPVSRKRSASQSSFVDELGTLSPKSSKKVMTNRR